MAKGADVSDGLHVGATDDIQGERTISSFLAESQAPVEKPGACC